MEEKKNYFNNVNKNTVKNNATRMLRKNDNKSIDLGLEVNVDPVHIKKEDVSAQMEDCAIDVHGPTLEVEGKDLVIPVEEGKVWKAGQFKVKVEFGGGRMNQSAAEKSYEMLGGLLNMISDMWDQKIKEDKSVDGFDSVE